MKILLHQFACFANSIEGLNLLKDDEIFIVISLIYFILILNFL
jgi:hypothetical protein